MMYILFILLFLFPLKCDNNYAGKSFAYVKQIKIDSVSNPCVEFDELNTAIRDGEIGKSAARDRINELLPKIKKYYSDKGGIDYSSDYWAFPLRGIGHGSIGGSNGSGYNASGYEYFDGNKHGGHPAHDIFIRDKNQDCLDDYTKNPVDVLSMGGGVVVATAPDWDPGSDLRGGKYIWIYDPYYDALFYYAHNAAILVQPGDIVKPGDKISEVGRTGLNAYKKRSPSHLHFSYFAINGGNVKPENIYEDLLSAKVIE